MHPPRVPEESVTVLSDDQLRQLPGDTCDRGRCTPDTMAAATVTRTPRATGCGSACRQGPGQLFRPPSDARARTPLPAPTGQHRPDVPAHVPRFHDTRAHRWMSEGGAEGSRGGLALVVLRRAFSDLAAKVAKWARRVHSDHRRRSASGSTLSASLTERASTWSTKRSSKAPRGLAVSHGRHGGCAAGRPQPRCRSRSGHPLLPGRDGDGDRYRQGRIGSRRLRWRRQVTACLLWGLLHALGVGADRDHPRPRGRPPRTQDRPSHSGTAGGLPGTSPEPNARSPTSCAAAGVDAKPGFEAKKALTAALTSCGQVSTAAR